VQWNHKIRVAIRLNEIVFNINTYCHIKFIGKWNNFLNDCPLWSEVFIILYFLVKSRRKTVLFQSCHLFEINDMSIPCSGNTRWHFNPSFSTLFFSAGNVISPPRPRCISQIHRIRNRPESKNIRINNSTKINIRPKSF